MLKALQIFGGGLQRRVHGIERQVTEPRLSAVAFNKARRLAAKGIGRVVDISDRRGASLNRIREVTRRIQVIMHAA